MFTNLWFEGSSLQDPESHSDPMTPNADSNSKCGYCMAQIIECPLEFQPPSEKYKSQLG